MPITIGSNIASLQAQRQLGRSSDGLSQAFERLSSGLRITHAADDAAGLAVAMDLNSRSRVYSQGIRNLNDGISALSIADGALASLSDLTMRQKELAEQASNGTYSLQQRKALQAESDALIDEFNRIVSTTKFNGNTLLDGTFRNLTLQAGYGSQDAISAALGTQSAFAHGTGSFTTGLTINLTNIGSFVAAGDLNGDGRDDIVATKNGGNIFALLNNGDGTFRVSQATAGIGTQAALIDINGDGKLDLAATNYTGGQFNVALGNGDGTFRAAQTATTSAFLTDLHFADFNNDGKLDALTGDGTNMTLRLGNGDGTFQAGSSIYVGFGGINALNYGDFNNDGIMDVVASNNQRFAIGIGKGDGTFSGWASFDAAPIATSDIEVADFNRDGFADVLVYQASAGSAFSISLGNGNGSFKAAVSYSAPGTLQGHAVISDLNGDGIMDFAALSNSTATMYTAIGNSDGSFKAIVTSTALGAGGGGGIAFGDFNGDGVKDVVSSSGGTSGSIAVAYAGTTTSAAIGYVNLYSSSGGRDALVSADTVLNRINAERGVIGAAQSRLQVANENLHSLVENYTAASSRIMDVDIAEESANLIRYRVMQEATTAILAQANIQPKIALQLLRE